MASKLIGLAFLGLAQIIVALTVEQKPLFMVRREPSPHVARQQDIKADYQEVTHVGKGETGTANSGSGKALDGERADGPERVAKRKPLMRRSRIKDKKVAKEAARGGSGRADGERSESLLEEEAEMTRTKGVTWSACGTPDNPCSCAAYRRRVVIRFQRKGRGSDKTAGFPAITPTTQENWYWRWKQHGSTPYSGTPPAEINKGFKTTVNFNAHNLPRCGGDTADSVDCTIPPRACSFQEEVAECPDDDPNCVTDLNIYDAKPGEYCCSAEKSYCSFKCPSADVNFTCREAIGQNFPGGMDPVGPEVEKECYMAQYPHGLNPDIGTDPMVNDTVDLIMESAGNGTAR